MHKLSSRLRKGMSGFLITTMIGSLMSTAAFADTSLKKGTYDIDAALSCYVQAMGGVEFSDGYGMLKGSSITVDDNGDAAITLELGTTSGLSVYGVACTAFLSDEEKPGYYDSKGEIQDAKYKLSTNTAANKSGEVNYIETLTFPVEPSVSDYTMWLYLDSNVMGCQLGDGSGDGASNTPGVLTKHTATVTVDWDSLDSGAFNSGSSDEDISSGNNGMGGNTVGGNGSGGSSSNVPTEGVYSADMSLSMYVSAMGGIEFADGIIKGNYMTVKDEDDGTYDLTLQFGKGDTISIYGVECTPFISDEEAPGYYDTDGKKQSADYKKSNGMVEAMTFPVSSGTKEYNLWLYVGSNVMGCQFGDGNGSGASNQPGVSTPYEAKLTIDWDSLTEGANGSTSSGDISASATIEYIVENTYEVEIPSKISLSSLENGVGTYQILTVALPDGGHMIVTADENGTLTNASGDTVEFTNVLESPDNDENKLDNIDSYLEGTITITSKAKSSGTYTGTLNFEISCY